MELITVLRALWRGRLFVVLSGLLAVFVGLLISYHVSFPAHLQSRQYNVALGSVNVLVDTPDSQVIDLSPKGADAVGTRANLLANLITTTPIKNAIAAHVGLPTNQLVVLAPPSGSVLAVTPAQAQGAISAAGRDAKIIAIRIDPALPVISIDTQAPDTALAVRLANGAVAGLNDYLKSVASTQNVPAARRLVLRQLGDAQVAISAKGPRKLYGAAAAIFLFIMALAAIVFLPSLVRALREAGEAERVEKDARAKAKALAAQARDEEDDDLSGPGLAPPPPDETPVIGAAPGDESDGPKWDRRVASLRARS